MYGVHLARDHNGNRDYLLGENHLDLPRAITSLVMFFGCWPLVAVELPLSPYPQKVHMGMGELVTKGIVDIDFSGNNADDHFASTELAWELKSIDGVEATIKTRAAGDGTAVF